MEGCRLNWVRQPESADTFELVALAPIDVDGSQELFHCDLMSPFVWRTPPGQPGVPLSVVAPPWRPGDVTGRMGHGTALYPPNETVKG
jgi:hypothetical protein